MACKFCPEIFIGEKGHLIQTCHGYKHRAKNRCHEWVADGLDDILVPVETYHLNNMFQGAIKHNQRFDFDRIPAIVELCWQAGADPCSNGVSGDFQGSESLNDLTFVANRTLVAWETLGSGVQKLLFVYPAKVCKYCSEDHVGPSGHKARLCGVFRAGEELTFGKIVWRRRPQDPPVLVDEGKGYYGRVPAILDLCVKAGALVPAKYNSMMKAQGLSGPAFC